MSGAEILGVIGVVATIIDLVSFGKDVLTRLDEFQKNVRELPHSFVNIAVQLPLLLDTLDRIREQSFDNSLSPSTEEALAPVILRLRQIIQRLDTILQEILPSGRAKLSEKVKKAYKSLVVQKDVDELAAVIRDFVNNLTVFQATRNVDLIVPFLKTFEERTTQRTVRIAEEPLSFHMLKYDTSYNSVGQFVGRERILQNIGNEFRNNTRVAIAGIGGVGKSRIAYQFCHSYEQEMTDLRHVLWVHGGTFARVAEAYRIIANGLAIGTSRDREDDRDVDRLRLVSDFLSNAANGSWLMILDNCDDQQLWLSASGSGAGEKKSLPLIEYLPRGNHGRILITTRDFILGKRLLEGQQSPIQLERLGPSEARLLLQSRLPQASCLSQEDADELTKALEYLPLTITQAAAYLEEIGITPSEYLDLLRAGESDIPELLTESIDDPSRDRESSNSIFQTWKISFEQIMKQNPRAADILSLMAVLDRQSISKDLLLNPGEGAIPFRAAIAKLVAFSLIEEDKEVSQYRFHRLVQVSTQRWLDNRGTLGIWQGTAVRTIAQLCPPHPHHQFWKKIEELSPHVQVVLGYNTCTPSGLIHRATILYTLGQYHISQGQDAISLEYLRESTAIRHEHLGFDHEDTLMSSSLLGVVYSKTKNKHLSMKIQSQVLEDATRTLGPCHRVTMKSMSRLAITYSKTKKLRYCRELQEKTLALMEQTLGKHDRDTLTEMSNLAYTAKHMGDFKAAEALELDLLSLRSNVLGPDHPDTITTIVSLARTFKMQKRLSDATKLELKAVALRKKVFGPKHVKTIEVMRILVDTYERQGLTVEANGIRLDIEEAQAENPMTHHEASGAKSKSAADLGLE